MRKGVRNLLSSGSTGGARASRKVPDTFSGFTLLEIILSLAILAGSLAALGEVMRLADQNAAMTGDETQAQIIAASIMDELVAGARMLSAVKQSEYEDMSDPPWLFSIVLEDAGIEELVAVRILVEQDIEAHLQPARVELVRWLPNPNFQSTTSAAESTSPSTTSGSSASSSGSSLGGGGGTP